MFSLLRLTAEEKRWCGYYTTRNADGSIKPGVIQRRYTQDLTLSAATPTDTRTVLATRRARVSKITWSGDVYAARVKVRDSVGESYTVDPLHIPLLAGVSPHSTLTVSPQIPPYPDELVAGDIAVHQGPRWVWLIEPNIVLPGKIALFLDYSLENPNDPNLIDGRTYIIQQCVEQWEFPGFQGGAM